jgi:hypothetical protein
MAPPLAPMAPPLTMRCCVLGMPAHPPSSNTPTKTKITTPFIYLPPFTTRDYAAGLALAVVNFRISEAIWMIFSFLEVTAVSMLLIGHLFNFVKYFVAINRNQPVAA